jgi:hypothetical protein
MTISMRQNSTASSRGERWLGRLLTVTVLVGAFWWYAWPWVRSDWLFLTVAALNLVLVVSAWAWMLRTGRRRESERTAQRERERGTDERIV